MLPSGLRQRSRFEQKLEARLSGFARSFVNREDDPASQVVAARWSWKSNLKGASNAE